MSTMAGQIALGAARIGRRIRPPRAKKNGLPPGPSWPAYVQLYAWIRHPLELMRYCRARYGTPFTLRLPRWGAIVIFDDPEAIREIFTGSSDVLHAGKANVPLTTLIGDSSLLVLDGPRHLRERKLLLPPFHGERMHRYGEVMREITLRRLERWPLGDVHPVHEHTQAITLDVILRTVFGLEEGARMDEVRAAIVEVADAFSNPTVMVPPLQLDLGPRSPWGRFVRAKENVDRLLYEQIRHRRDQRAGDDVLGLMLEARYEDGRPMSDRELRDELVTLLAAGHETTATALAWTMHLLSEHPAELARAHAEIDAAKDVGPHVALPYLDAVIKESLRLRPVIMNVGRVLTAPETIAGIALEPGMMVAPSILLTHYNPVVWPDPERFDPDRFVDAKTSPYAFLPFGGGVRRCLGMAFALYEMRIVLAAILGQHTLRPAPGFRVRTARRSVTLSPSEGMPLIVARR